MTAADFVVIPVPPEDFGAQGLRVVHQAVDRCARLNPRLRLAGHLVTRYDGRLAVHRAYEAKLRALYADTVFTTVVPEASAFKVALACRTPVSYQTPGSKAARAMAAVGAELIDRARAAGVDLVGPAAVVVGGQADLEVTKQRSVG